MFFSFNFSFHLGFSNDMDTVDSVVPFFFKTMIYVGFMILSVFWVIIATLPLASIVIGLMMFVYIYLFKIFLRTIIAAKRLELQTKTVLYNRFEELTGGLQTILAYEKTNQFTKALNFRLERNVRCSYMLMISFKWLALRNEMIGVVILVSTSLFSIYNSDMINGGEAALVLSFAVQLLTLLMGLMALVAEFFINFVSIGRIYRYLELEEESDTFHFSFPPDDWPKHGKIKFENYSSSYTECREPTLRKLDFKVNKHSLVTIVGKTGSGKSTLALSMFNAIRSVGGRILIDNIDITKISLKSLRTNLAIFPQDAVLFSGLIRFNLDPEQKYSDSELWTALDYVGMKDPILCLPGNLSYEIDGQKSALSLGQRQLLCLARTLLNKSRVMIIDETDCQFDLEIEVRLRKLFKTVFKDRTILLITKNIEHIQAADKVLFLHDGQIQDYKTPEQIFGDQNNNIDAVPNNNLDILDVLNNNE